MQIMTTKTDSKKTKKTNTPITERGNHRYTDMEHFAIMKMRELGWTVEDIANILRRGTKGVIIQIYNFERDGITSKHFAEKLAAKKKQLPAIGMRSINWGKDAPPALQRLRTFNGIANPKIVEHLPNISDVEKHAPAPAHANGLESSERRCAALSQELELVKAERDRLFMLLKNMTAK